MADGSYLDTADDPMALIQFILDLSGNSHALDTYAQADYYGRLAIIQATAAPPITDQVHLDALAQGDASRIHLALTRNLGPQVHTIDYAVAIMQKMLGPVQ